MKNAAATKATREEAIKAFDAACAKRTARKAELKKLMKDAELEWEAARDAFIAATKQG